MNNVTLIATVAKILEVEKGTLSLESEFENLAGWDSLCWLNLALEIESQSQYENLINNVDKLKTIGDLLRFMNK
ncbi:acyl carrier protein [Alphaproteobacteria bacterium]|nr:acyl carrier protein [Alphaproteobacteria bacterium]